MKNIVFNVCKIFIFIIVFVILYSFLTVLKRPQDGEFDNFPGLYAEQKNTLDMVYLGGSASFVYYSPLDAYQKYGISSYVYGISSMQPEMYITMLKEMYKTQKPKLLVIDARPFEYREEKHEWAYAAYRNFLTGIKFNKNKIDFVNKYVEKTLNHSKKSYFFDLDLYHSSKKVPSIKRSLMVIFNKLYHPYKGFYFVPKVSPIDLEDIKTFKETKISKDTEDILIELLDYLDTKEVKVLFIICPYKETEKEKEKYNYIEKIINKRGYDFIDTNERYKDMNLNSKTDFYNISHVNIFGSEKYTDYLAKYILPKYNLPNHNGKLEYFNKYIEEWNSKKKEVKEIIQKKIYEGKK